MIQNPVELLKRRQGKDSLRTFGKKIPCSAAHLSDIFNGKRAPGPKILRFLGLSRKTERTVTYQRIKNSTQQRQSPA